MPLRKKNNRKHNRVSLSRLVRIQTSRASSEKKMVQLINLSESGMKFHVVDLSKEGLQLEASELHAAPVSTFDLSKLKEGETLSFCLHLGSEHPDVLVLGKLVWVDEESHSGRVVRIRAGVQFIDLSEADCKRIQLYVAAFES